MKSPVYKVLIIDDDETRSATTERVLGKARVCRFDVERTSNGSEALELMRQNRHDACLLSSPLTAQDGLELLQNAVSQGCREPILLLEGQGRKGWDERARDRGAADWLLHSQITTELLERALRYAIEHKRTTEAWRMSQEFARNLVDSSLDMIIAVDLDRKITEFNRAAQRTFGYELEEVRGKHVHILYDAPHTGESISESILKNEGCLQEVVNVRKNGERFPSLLGASALRNARGELVGAMGISRDITEQKKAEAAMKRWNEELEQRVGERTQQLEMANQQLKAQIEERQRVERERAWVVKQLQAALAQVKTLSGLLPICCHCKRIRDDKGYWNQLEIYISQHSSAEFTHGICPECRHIFYPDVRIQTEEQEEPGAAGGPPHRTNGNSQCEC